MVGSRNVVSYWPSSKNLDCIVCVLVEPLPLLMQVYLTECLRDTAGGAVRMPKMAMLKIL